MFLNVSKISRLNCFISVEKQSRTVEEEEEGSLFSGLEKKKKSRESDASKNEEKYLMFNLF